MNHLLFIGIDEYILQTKLNCCVKDCKDIKDVLLEKYSFTAENTIEIYNEDASNLKIQEKLKEYHATLTENDNLVIYYSGHGGYDKTIKKGSWIPYDSDPDNFTTWIGNETILLYLKQIKSKHIFLISDSCFSRSILITEPTKSIFSNAKDYDFDPSRWALTSGAEECMDGSPGENSLFGETILQILKDNTDDLRVSKLIELVKQKFHSNLFQKPQGYPLNDPKHKTGEFIFKVINNDYEHNQQIKGYRDFLTLLQLYKRNADFKELSKYENKSLRIGYQIYQEHDKVLKKVTYFLHLYEGINQQKTLEHIREKHSEIFREKCLIILIPKEKKQINPEIRKQNISDKFQPLNIFYIDEFIREQCTPKDLVTRPEENYLDIPNFILPSLDFNKKIIENATFFIEWLQQENEPIMILKGEGGIGKTTFAQYIADKFLKNNQDASVLFINSSEIRGKLEKNYDSIGVYNFYEALHSSTTSDHEMLNEDLFRLNLDAGNFLLIIDGLDEVISKVAKFNVDDFLNSIIEYTSDIGNGKIIITCRSYFWELSKFATDIIKTIEILPFNAVQTLKFFEKSFANNQRKIDKSLKIAEEYKFIDDNGDNFFHPYVLAVICSIVESDQQIIQSESSFTSKILEKSVKNDYIIYRICYRERLRVEQISVDEQVEFFSYWSIKRRGLISIANFSKELSESLGKHIDKTTIEAFKSHPFILVNKKTVQFRYDFFADYFKSVYISRHLMLEGQYEEISTDFLEILSENCWYGSGMISDIKNRIMTWTEGDILKCSDLANQILKCGLPEKIKGKSLANLFNICLAINFKFKSNSIEQNTILLKALFCKNKNEIFGLHISNMHGENLRFDFSDLIMRNCFIDNYQAYWKCTFNDNTFFIDSHLLNLEFDLDKKIPIPKHNFQNCTTDIKFSFAFKKDDLNNNATVIQISDYLREFFGLFYTRGMLHGQTIDKSHKGREHHPSLNLKYSHIWNQIFPFEEIIDFMKKENVIEFYEDYAEKKVKIVSNFRNEVIKFINDGAMSKNINTIISKLSDMARF